MTSVKNALMHMHLTPCSRVHFANAIRTKLATVYAPHLAYMTSQYTLNQGNNLCLMFIVVIGLSKSNGLSRDGRLRVLRHRAQHHHNESFLIYCK